MKKASLFSAFVLSVSPLLGADLYFSSGSIINNTNALLSLSGPTNLIASIERLNPQSDAWESQGTVTLYNGQASFTNNLYNNIYGFYRAKGTNGTIYFSTNAFGSFIGQLAQNYTLVGNIFGAQSITNILPNPHDGTQVLRWNTGSQSYTTYTLDMDLLGGWYPSTPNIDAFEAFWVRNPSTNSMKYIVSGLFTTNQVSKTIVTNLNLLVSPQYHVTDYATWRVDTLNTNRLGGLANIPVQSSDSPQSLIYQQVSTTPSYTTNVLTAGGEWWRNGTNVSIHLEITEGFWLHKLGTNSSTWNFQRPIW